MFERSLTPNIAVYVATATDATGNVSTASAERVLVVDTIAPAASTVTTSFAGRDASFHVDTELEATLQCRLDLRQWESCTRTPTYSALPSSPTRKALARVKRAALTSTVSAPDAKPVTRNVTLTRG